ncbi:hypothetical protein Tco_1565829, partial [Tanacetum coccineum]
MASSTKALIVKYASEPTPPSPPPSPLLPLSTLLPRIPSPPLLLPPTRPFHINPTYAHAPLGYKAALKRLCLTALASRFEVRESSTTAAARQTWHTLAHRVDYRFIDTL